MGQTLDLQLHQIDFILHGNHIPWTLLQKLIGYPLMTRFLDYCYLLWGTLYIFTIYWMALSRRSFLRIQYFFSLAACWIIIGNILAGFLASAGPCFFDKVTSATSNPYQHMMTYLNAIPELSVTRVQTFLWQARSQEILIPWGGISAMPSMHVSIAVLSALAFADISKAFAVTMGIFAIIVQIGSVHLGFHYAIDGYLATVATLAIWFATKWMLRCLGLAETLQKAH